MTTVYCTSFQAGRLGLVYVASTDSGVCKISFANETKRGFMNWLQGHFREEDVCESMARNKTVIDELRGYLNGKVTKFACSLLLLGTPFQKRVWNEVRKIPYGETLTYKQLAHRVGVPRGYQAVGQANALNPLPIVVPCHRVVGSDGSLTGYSTGVKTKELLLKLEGVILL
jgi:O-6-methylguanine DNA methyltransferase